jgi:hypothetical protein
MPIVIDSFTASPTGVQPVNTTYTITLTAHDTGGGSITLTAAVTDSAGTVFTTPTPITLTSAVPTLTGATLTRSDAGLVTPVPGQPAGTFKWTVVF